MILFHNILRLENVSIQVKHVQNYGIRLKSWNSKNLLEVDIPRHCVALSPYKGEGCMVGIGRRVSGILENDLLVSQVFCLLYL